VEGVVVTPVNVKIVEVAMKRAKVVGRIPKRQLKERIIHSRRALYGKPLTLSLGELLREAFRTGYARS